MRKILLEILEPIKTNWWFKSRSWYNSTSGDDLTKVAQIRYSEIPELEKKIKKEEAELLRLETSGQKILKEEIDAEDIARVVARWTGIQISKMLESEVKKLSRAEAELSNRVVGQDDAIASVANAIRRSRVGISEEKNQWDPSYLLVQLVLENRTS